MPIAMNELVLYGSANMQDTDSGTQGGAIATTKKPLFADILVTGNIQIVSSSGSDTTPTVAIEGRSATGAAINETKTLNGQTVVPMTGNTSWERILKAVKSGTTVGDVAVETVTAVTSGTAQAGAAQSITLAAGASAVDDAYAFMVVRLTGGTGAGQIRFCTKTDQAVAYNGTTKVLYVDRAWGTNPDATTTYKISYGCVFEKTPSEILEVRRIFYNAEADAPGGSTRNYYEKVFIKNIHGSLSLLSAVIKEFSDPTAKISFGVAATLDDSASTTNRVTAPGGITFNSSDKDVANSKVHTAGAAQGIWLNLTLAAGSAPAKTTYILRETGSSV